MGKSELSKISPFQLVILFMIAELAAIPIATNTIPALHGIVAIFALLFLQVIISQLSIKNEWFKNFINGKPSILIENGQINVNELKKLRISLNDLLEQLRLGSSPSIADVDYAVLESNGGLSIIPKSGKKPLTTGELGLDPPVTTMPLVAISDGVLYRDNLKRLGVKEQELQNQVRAAGLSDYKDVFLGFYDENRKLHIYSYDPATSAASEVTL